MPANPGRRALIADTAIEILAEVGAGGLTHRTVDSRAQLPPGTTSNFYRTRTALLQATAERAAALHWAFVERVRTSAPSPQGRAGLAEFLARLVAAVDGDAATRNLARLELFLEGKRQPGLQPALEDIYEAAMEAAQVIVRSAGVHAEPNQVRMLARILNGLVFDQLTLPDKVLSEQELTDLLNRLLGLVFDT
ncbi:TetR/AcrR family transcriptional regulator [Kibdelosporangium lantanae]